MKIVATVTDTGSVVHAGGRAESRSAIIEIPDDQLPKIVKDYFESARWAREAPNRYHYRDLTFSFIEPEEEQ